MKTAICFGLLDSTRLPAARRAALQLARARFRARGFKPQAASADLYEAYCQGTLSLLELRYALEGRHHRRLTPACWRLLVPPDLNQYAATGYLPLYLPDSIAT